MRRATKIVLGVGIFLLVATGLWLLIAPGQLVRYPDNLDKTAVAKGELTLYLDPRTGTARAAPLAVPLEIRRHLRVVDSTGTQATVQETSSERAGPLPEQTFQQQYVIDRGSLKDLASDSAYAYTQGNVTDRSPFYSINLPFGTGSGPYQIWKNETGTAYAFKQDGAKIQRDGITMIPMAGALTNVPATSAYVDQLRGQGIAKVLTAQQMAARLKAQGVDLQSLAQQVLPSLTPAQRKLVQAALAQAVPLKYFVSVNTRLLVEPTTGAIVSLDRIDQTLSAAPDLKVFSRLAALLSKPPLAGQPTVEKLKGTLSALGAPKPVRVLTTSYRQTPQSVADFASYAKGKAADIKLVKTTIPAVAGIAGLLVLLAGALMASRDRRRPPSDPTGTAPPPQQRPAAHA